MATFPSRGFPRRPHIRALLAGAFVVVAAAGVGAPTARGESIQAADFKIDIASNLAWIDNRQPAVGLKLWRQTAMEQAVLASRPYVRVTNNSAGGVIEDFQLNLRNRPATAVTGCVWDANQQASKWRWSDAAQTANFRFANPIESGDSFTIRLATGPSGTGDGIYALQQNFFAPGQPIFGEQRASGMSGFGVLGVTVYDPTRASRSTLRSLAAPTASLASDPVVAIEQFHYKLDTVVIDPYKTFGQQVGITIQAVPEPSGLALVAAAAGIGGVAAYRRRRTAPCG